MTPRTLRRKGLVLFKGFPIHKRNLAQVKRQLASIVRLTPLRRQFIGTMIDTEVATGYFLRKNRASRDVWVAYVGVKMKYGGDLRYLAQLISHIPPGRHLYANTIKGVPDLRWSLQVQGIVAVTLLRKVRPYLHNEKSIVEVDCILDHGPIVPASSPHPFLDCGAMRVRRGVWRWPIIDDMNEQGGFG